MLILKLEDCPPSMSREEFLKEVCLLIHRLKKIKKGKPLIGYEIISAKMRMIAVHLVKARLPRYAAMLIIKRLKWTASEAGPHYAPLNPKNRTELKYKIIRITKEKMQIELLSAA